MKYNFDEIIDRKNTNSMNVDGYLNYLFAHKPNIKFPVDKDKLFRMWIADMEFAVAPNIIEAINKKINDRIFGYTQVPITDEYYDIFLNWCKKMYDWTFEKEELLFSPGIIPALYDLVKAITLNEDDKVLITSPSYGFFHHAVAFNRRTLVCSKLINKNGDFFIDFDDFEKKASDPKVKLIIWCNPHNPTGRVWTEEELKKIAGIVEKNNLWLLSDDIHCDLLRTGVKHVPIGKIMPSYKKLITCMAASKTFNIAGLMFSNIIIRDKKLRETFIANDKTLGMINAISYVATKAAYKNGEEWLIELKKYLDINFEYLNKFIKENFPKVKFKIPKSTYLAWIDFSEYLKNVDDIPVYFAEKVGLLLEGGDKLFVDNAKNFIRLNLAMPLSMLKEGLEKLKEALM